MSSKKITFGSAALESLVIQGLIMALSLCSLFFIARLLPTSDVGVYLVAFALISGVVVMFALGLPHAFAVHAANFGRLRLASSATSACLALAAAAGVAIWGGLAHFWREADIHINGVPLIPLLTIVVFLNVMGTSLLRSMLAFRSANRLSVLPNILFCVELGYFFVRREAMDAAHCLFLLLLSQLAALVLLGMTLIRTVGGKWPSPRRSDIYALFRFGGGVHVGNASKEVMYRASLIIVQILIGPVAAATFGIVSRLIDAIAKFIDAICLNLVPFIASSDRDTGRAMLFLTLDFVVGILLPGIVVVAIFSTQLLPRIFGPSYSEAAVLFQYAIFTVLPLAIWKVLANEAIARLDLKIYIASAVIGALGMVTLNFALMPQLGLFGTIVAMLSAYCIAIGVIIFQKNPLRGYVPLRAMSKVVRATWKKGVQSGE